MFIIRRRILISVGSARHESTRRMTCLSERWSETAGASRWGSVTVDGHAIPYSSVMLGPL